MTEEESRLAFEELQKIMIQAGLGWAVTQVAEELRFGRTSRKSVRVRSEPPDELLFQELGGRRRTSRIIVSATQEYTAKEQLRLLLDALERASVEVHEMRELMKTSLSKRDPKWVSVKLVRTDEEQPTPVTIDRNESNQAGEVVANLRVAILALRRTI